MPDAKVLYSSATGASEPKNLGGWLGVWQAGIGWFTQRRACSWLHKAQGIPTCMHAWMQLPKLARIGPLCTAGYMTRLGLWGAKEAVEFINLLNK